MRLALELFTVWYFQNLSADDGSESQTAFDSFLFDKFLKIQKANSTLVAKKNSSKEERPMWKSNLRESILITFSVRGLENICCQEKNGRLVVFSKKSIF